METDFWLQCWREGHTGFHNDKPFPLLEQHWPTLDLPADSRVLVPLCGKSLDMLWLASQGHRVLGVELSPLAVEQFLSENHLDADVHDSPMGRHYVTDRIEVIQGNAFELDNATLSTCHAIYDRAALIALPPDMRGQYAGTVYARLPADCRGLMITLEYPQEDMDGPPFSVDAQEVERRFGADFGINLEERRDILATQPGLAARGMTSLHTSVYTLRHKPA